MVYDTSLNRLGVADVYESLIWIRRYFANGTFELVAPANQTNIKLLKKHNLITLESDNEIAYISTISITQDEAKNATIKATGALYSGKLSQHTILIGATNLKDLIEDNLREIVLIVDDVVANITFDNDGYGKNLGEVVEALARRDNFGYKVVLESGTLIFKVFYGTDRSKAQSENPRVIFSQEYENLLTSDYLNSDVGTINTVYARCKVPAGVQACIPPTYDIIPDDGIERFEAYIEVDAVTYDIEQTIGDGGDTITLTYLNYSATLANMQAEAEKALVEVQENFEGAIAFAEQYKDKYDLGDVVTVFNDTWGISTNQRITEITEVYDNVQNSIIPTFGNPARTILDIIKE